MLAVLEQNEGDGKDREGKMGLGTVKRMVVHTVDSSSLNTIVLTITKKSGIISDV